MIRPVELNQILLQEFNPIPKCRGNTDKSSSRSLHSTGTETFSGDQSIRKATDLLRAIESADDTCASQEKAEGILKCFDDKNSHDAVSAEEGYLDSYDRINSPRRYITTGFNLLDESLFLVQAFGMTVEQIKSKAIELHAEIIFINYLTLIHAEGKTPYERASSITLGLHTLAQKHGITIFALAQLNRHGEEELDMTFLRDSGQIEQDADVILLLNNPNLKVPDAMAPGRNLIIAKNREGNVGSFRMDFDGDKQRFRIISTGV